MEPIVIEAVLHPTDFSDSDFGAITHALRIALAAKGRLTFLHVGPKGEDVDWDEFPQTRGILAAWGVIPENASHDDVHRLGLAVRKSVRKGNDLIKEISGEIRKGGADLIVLSTHQRSGVTRLFRKHIAETISREIRRPTLFLPRDIEGFVDQETGKTSLTSVLIPITHDPEPRIAIEAAVGLALLFTPGPIHFRLLYVGYEDEVPEVEFPEHADWTVEKVVRPGGVVKGILDEAHEIEAKLIVMATVGPEGLLDTMRGTTTEQVLQQTNCPLLAVPA